MSEVIVFAGCAFRTTPAGLVDTRKEIRSIVGITRGSLTPWSVRIYSPTSRGSRRPRELAAWLRCWRRSSRHRSASRIVIDIARGSPARGSRGRGQRRRQAPRTAKIAVAIR